MTATNANYLQKVPGKFYIKTMPTLSVPYSVANESALYSQFNALSWTDADRIASIIDLSIETETGADRVETITDDNGTIQNGSRPAIMATATWYESGNIDIIATALGTTVTNVAGSSTPVAGENKGLASAVWNPTNAAPIKLAYKNGNNTVVTSIVVKQGATYGAATTVTATDYQVSLGSDGYTYIVPIVGGKTNTIWVDYTYTPNTSKLTSLQVAYRDLPRLLVKAVSEPDANGKVDTHYLYDCTIDGTVADQFVDLARSGELQGSEISFMTNKLGFKLSNKERI